MRVSLFSRQAPLRALQIPHEERGFLGQKRGCNQSKFVLDSIASFLAVRGVFRTLSQDSNAAQIEWCHSKQLPCSAINCSRIDWAIGAIAADRNNNKNNKKTSKESYSSLAVCVCRRVGGYLKSPQLHLNGYLSFWIVVIFLNIWIHRPPNSHGWFSSTFHSIGVPVHSSLTKREISGELGDFDGKYWELTYKVKCPPPSPAQNRWPWKQHFAKPHRE